MSEPQVVYIKPGEPGYRRGHRHAHGLRCKTCLDEAGWRECVRKVWPEWAQAHGYAAD